MASKCLKRFEHTRGQRNTSESHSEVPLNTQQSGNIGKVDDTKHQWDVCWDFQEWLIGGVLLATISEFCERVLWPRNPRDASTGVPEGTCMAMFITLLFLIAECWR